MKRLILLTVVLSAFAMAVSAQGKASRTVSDSLEKMERQAWDAFGRGDGKFFESFYSTDATQIDPNGILSRSDAIKGIASKPCELRSYSFNDFKVTMLNATTALVTYGAMQDATCGGQTVPGKLFASTVYVKRNGKWHGAFHQESYPL